MGYIPFFVGGRGYLLHSVTSVSRKIVTTKKYVHEDV
jgi:hypothetical protein